MFAPSRFASKVIAVTVSVVVLAALLSPVSAAGGVKVPAVSATGASVTSQVAVAVPVPSAFSVVCGTLQMLLEASVNVKAATVELGWPVRVTVAVVRYVVVVPMSVLCVRVVVVLVLTCVPSASVTVTVVVCCIGE
jgi:hypothetical protein